MRKILVPVVFVAGLAVQALAIKSRQETFAQPCESVWKASVSVAKGQQYRLISISKEEQIISLAVGGVWSGERIISLSLAPGIPGPGCVATVQSRFSGLAHSDGPDLLDRIHVQLVGEELGTDSRAFEKFKHCVDDSSANEPKCEAKFRSRIAAEKPARSPDSTMWNITRP